MEGALITKDDCSGLAIIVCDLPTNVDGSRRRCRTSTLTLNKNLHTTEGSCWSWVRTKGRVFRYRVVSRQVIRSPLTTRNVSRSSLFGSSTLS